MNPNPTIRLLRKQVGSNDFSLFPLISGWFKKQKEDFIKKNITTWTSKYIFLFVWYFRMDEAYLTYYLIWSNLILFGKSHYIQMKMTLRLLVLMFDDSIIFSVILLFYVVCYYFQVVLSAMSSLQKGCNSIVTLHYKNIWYRIRVKSIW